MAGSFKCEGEEEEGTVLQKIHMLEQEEKESHRGVEESVCNGTP